MKNALIIPATIFVFLMHACKNDSVKTDDIKISNLSGKVFALSDTIDKNECVCVPFGTDNNWPTYIFVNDSVFIKTVDNCCQPSTISHYTGLYKIARNKLIFTYDSTQIVYYVESAEDSLGQLTDKLIEHIEIEPSGTKMDSLQILLCKKNPYFIETWYPWEGKIIALSDSRLESYFNRMKKIGAWDKMTRKQ